MSLLEKNNQSLMFVGKLFDHPDFSGDKTLRFSCKMVVLQDMTDGGVSFAPFEGRFFAWTVQRFLKIFGAKGQTFHHPDDDLNLLSALPLA